MCIASLPNWAPRGFGDLRRVAFYFQGAGSTSYYFRGAGEQAHCLGDLGISAQNKKISKGKASILFDFFNPPKTPL